MQTSRVTRGKDKTYINVRNVDVVDMVDGDVVVFSVVTTVEHGTDVLKSTAASQLTVAGVISGSIAIGAYGWCQVHGFHPNVKTTVAALAAGLVVNSDAAGACVAAAVEGAYLGVSLKLGAANRAGIMIGSMSR